MRYLTLLALSLLAACSDNAPLAPTDQMVRTAKIYTVEEASPTMRFEFVGRIEPLQTVDMSFQVGGPIESIPVLEGQTVKQGDLIAALESNEFDLALREATAQLKLAREDLKRKQKLLLDKGIARSTVDDAETILELRQVQVDKAQEALRDSRLHSPFDGYVGRRYLDSHTNVNPNEPVVRLYDMSQLLVVTSVPEVILATATPEQVVELSAEFAFLKGQKFPLTYRENRGYSDPLSHTYEVSFSLDSNSASNNRGSSL
ncbi:MAG: efflux RND transporter periplasmic adaptor subunit [Pseudomonadales bacterium]